MVREGTVGLTGGRVVGWREAGDPAGRVLVWCHGGLSSSGELAFLDTAAAARGVRVIGLDRPGIGRSSLWEVATVAGWPDVVLACAERLDLPRFSVAGWSAGGPYALACARRLEERLDAVTVVAGMYPVTDPARRRELGLRTDRVLLPLAGRHPVVARLAVAPFRWLPERGMWRLTRSSAGEAERRALTPEVRPAVTAMLHAAVQHGAGGVVADYRRVGSDWGFSLHDVARPVTVLQGAADGMVPARHAELLAADLGEARLRVIADAGHFLPLTHAEEIVASLDA